MSARQLLFDVRTEEIDRILQDFWADWIMLQCIFSGVDLDKKEVLENEQDSPELWI